MGMAWFGEQMNLCRPSFVLLGREMCETRRVILSNHLTVHKEQPKRKWTQKEKVSNQPVRRHVGII